MGALPVLSVYVPLVFYRIRITGLEMTSCLVLNDFSRMGGVNMCYLLMFSSTHFFVLSPG